MIRRFASGVALLARGFGFWRRRPEAMALGLLPAAIVFAVMVAGLITLGINLPGLVEWATPFADGWDAFWANALRYAIAFVAFTGAVVLAAITFTALTLAVGDPFYERIWRAVELDLGGEVPEHGAGFWKGVADAAGLVALGIVAALVVALVGFIPLVGGVAAPVLGVVASGWLLARELTSRAFDARGISGSDRAALLRGSRAQLLGFGVATQLCFLVPLGAIITMPAAVAGGAMLARGVLDTAPAAPLPASPAELPPPA
ncbi:EI24 domain-containing protein [Agromyces sp. SYSU K20354]|uniref:EI24 domain-containing protein n=1 Tax=Agromyces cavernae TaxID=2898659 RepID=UPI001E57099E|nr:EI24 domain-containing protein [Agromyces cavernae]MCD2442996.1 EI24 domain-containing protein [Agromyces cavernae]